MSEMDELEDMFDDQNLPRPGGEVLHPEVMVQLSGEDGNAFFIIGRIRQALRRAGVSPEEVQKFTDEAMASDYNHVLQTAMRWVDVA